MAKTKMVIALILLFSIVTSMSAMDLNSGYINRSFGGNIDEKVQQDEFDIGSKLAFSLMKGCSIFIGTVMANSEPISDTGAAANNVVVHTRVSMTEDEWLWGDQSQRKQTVQLERVFRPNNLGFNSVGWDVWNGIDVRSGNRLLVVVYNDEEENRVASGAMNKFGLILSDETLFSSIQDTLALHALYMQNPEEIAGAPDWINTKTDAIFSGYLISFLRRQRGFGSMDTEALVLSKLLGNKRVLTTGWFFIRQVLEWLMLEEDPSLSNATRDSVTEALVVAGSSDNVVLAKDAIAVLLRLGDNNKLDMQPFLNAERRRKISRTYRTVLKGDAQKGHPEFESQLNAKHLD